MTHGTKQLLNAAATMWCRTMHDDVTSPRHGTYHCRCCYRVYAVPWNLPSHAPSTDPLVVALASLHERIKAIRVRCATHWRLAWHHAARLIITRVSRFSDGALRFSGGVSA